ncbi:hypothetical protein JOE09_005179 [Pantoea coffeiphila]|nr:hypothetical protein [Pantoea coffeiphila]
MSEPKDEPEENPDCEKCPDCPGCPDQHLEYPL